MKGSRNNTPSRPSPIHAFSSLHPTTFSPSSSPSLHLWQCLGRKSQLRPPTRITKDHKLALQEDIPENTEANPIITLNPTEACSTPITDGGVVHVITRYDGAIPFDCKSDGGQSSRAGEDIAAVGLGVGRSLDLGVVCGDDGVREEEEGGAGVGDSGDGRGYGVAGADGVAGGGEAPESLAVVDSGVGDVAGVF